MFVDSFCSIPYLLHKEASPLALFFAIQPLENNYRYASEFN